MEELSNELHRPARRHYETRQVIVGQPHDTWSMDLVDMKEVLEYNNGYRYLLTCIDLASRFAWVVKLKDKTGIIVAKAIAEIIERAKAKPRLLWVDQGSEFYNTTVEALLRRHNIKMYHTFGDKKAVFVERFNRTLKTIMWRYFTQEQTRNWVDVVDDMVDEYNQTKHRILLK